MKCHICHKEIPEDKIFSYKDKYNLQHVCCELCYHYIINLKNDSK